MEPDPVQFLCDKPSITLALVDGVFGPGVTWADLIALKPGKFYFFSIFYKLQTSLLVFSFFLDFLWVYGGSPTRRIPPICYP